ncbi:WGxxGxxG family protein [Saccharopolyspora aridisoli]|uniref:WGxxGxxG family protein n=1 Tax=Saccharopolyspora aridisoli TaxID=2530385 RepID=UPI0038B63715
MKRLARTVAAAALAVGLTAAPGLGFDAATPSATAASGLAPVQEQPEQQKDDNDQYWGLFGLLGLAGLAGLMRRQQQSSERPSAGRGPGA